MEKVELETEPDIQKSRKTLVEEAVARKDWPTLRELSLLPGGFDGARVQAWWVSLKASVAQHPVLTRTTPGPSSSTYAHWSQPMMMTKTGPS